MDVVAVPWWAVLAVVLVIVGILVIVRRGRR
jgi:hypothetical protein